MIDLVDIRGHGKFDVTPTMELMSLGLDFDGSEEQVGNNFLDLWKYIIECYHGEENLMKLSVLEGIQVAAEFCEKSRDFLEKSPELASLLSQNGSQ